MNGKGATRETEVVAHAIKHHGKNLFSVLAITSQADAEVLLLLTGIMAASVHEGVLLPGVAVEVTVQLNLTALESLSYHLFDGKRLREQLGRGILILPVQIVA